VAASFIEGGNWSITTLVMIYTDRIGNDNSNYHYLHTITTTTTTTLTKH